ncbi:MAG: hypothetical protein ABIR98_03610 [Usitatibacter sp.]
MDAPQYSKTTTHSPTALAGHLSCPHLTQLERQRPSTIRTDSTSPPAARKPS